MYEEISQKQLESMIKRLPKTMKIKRQKECSKAVNFDSYWLDDQELFYIDIRGKQIKAYITDYFKMIIQRQ